MNDIQNNIEIYLINIAYHGDTPRRDYYTITLVNDGISTDTVIWSEEMIASLMKRKGVPVYTALPSNNGKYTVGSVCHLMPNGHLRTNWNDSENDNIGALHTRRVGNCIDWLLKLALGNEIWKSVISK